MQKIPICLKAKGYMEEAEYLKEMTPPDTTRGRAPPQFTKQSSLVLQNCSNISGSMGMSELNESQLRWMLLTGQRDGHGFFISTKKTEFPKVACQLKLGLT